MNSIKLPRIETLLRLGLGALFIFASFSKIADPAGFAASISNYRMLPELLVALMAAVLPWLELLCGLALLLNRWTPGASLLIVLMNAVFIVAIASAMARGLDISCGCFSTSGAGSRAGLARLLEDLLFLAAACWLYLRAAIGLYATPHRPGR